jgi:hypothetical protein
MGSARSARERDLVSALVGPNGAPVFADPLEGEMEVAIARLRRQLLTHAGPPGTILDQHGRPLNPKPMKLRRGFAEWVGPRPAADQQFESYGVSLAEKMLPFLRRKETACP